MVGARGRPEPPRPRREYYELALERIAAADVAVEISTAGLRKPVGEMYPAHELLELLVAAGKPVSLSSDAHEPESIGQGYDRALELMRAAGVRQVCVFDQRVRRLEPLG